MVYEACIRYVLENCIKDEIEEVTGCESKEELQSFQADLVSLIKNCTNKEFWYKEY